MTSLLVITGWILFGLGIVVALILDLVGLFGNWVILGEIVLVWGLSGQAYFDSYLGLGGLLGLAILGEVLETALAGYGAKKFGGSKGSMVAALVGCLGGAVLGTPLFPVVGTLIGACVGAFAAAGVYDYLQHERGVKDAALIGAGAALGKVGGLFAKLFCGIAMLVVAYIIF